jgi:hypothetical protein
VIWEPGEARNIAQNLFDRNAAKSACWVDSGMLGLYGVVVTSQEMEAGATRALEYVDVLRQLGKAHPTLCIVRKASHPEAQRVRRMWRNTGLNQELSILSSGWYSFMSHQTDL